MSDSTNHDTDDAAPRKKKGTQSSALTRLLDTVEWLGNLLPHPVTLFVILHRWALSCYQACLGALDHQR